MPDKLLKDWTVPDGVPRSVAGTIADDAARAAGSVVAETARTVVATDVGKLFKQLAPAVSYWLLETVTPSIAWTQLATSGEVAAALAGKEAAGVAASAVAAHAELLEPHLGSYSLVSASARTKIGIGPGASGGNLGTQTARYIYYRSRHKSVLDVRDPYAVFWNGAADTSAGNSAWEKGPGGGAQPIRLRMAFVTGVADPLQLDQSNSTLTPCTFFGLATGVRRCKDLTYTTRTWAQFQAAGGAVSGDGYAVTIPSGWSVECDELTGLQLAAGQTYFVQLEHEMPDASAGTPVQGARTGPFCPLTSIGDARLVSFGTTPTVGSDGLNVAHSRNWSSANVSGAALLANNFVCSPIAVIGKGAAGTRTVAVDGDSIVDESNDLDGDADGVKCALARALNIAGYSTLRVAVAGSSMGNRLTYGGDGYRLGLLEYADTVISEHGHNDAANLNGTTTVPTMRSFNQRLRSAMRAAGKKRVVRTNLTPTTNAGNTAPSAGWALTDNPYTVFLPYVRRSGSYSLVAPDIVAGDHEAWLDIHSAHGCVGALWGAAADTSDGTHPNSVAAARAATYLAPMIPSAVGFTK